jgi:GUCT (NUC152) domain
MIRSMKDKKDNSGVVFDIYEDKVERFLDHYEHQKASHPEHKDYEVSRCTALPELEDDEDMQSGAWRAGGGAGGGDYRSKYQSYSGG